MRPLQDVLGFPAVAPHKRWRFLCFVRGSAPPLISTKELQTGQSVGSDGRSVVRPRVTRSGPARARATILGPPRPTSHPYASPTVGLEQFDALFARTQ
jgi:hypothetical protein